MSRPHETQQPEPSPEQPVRRQPSAHYRHDLGPLGDRLLPPRIVAAPALLPIPLDMISDEDWQPPQAVVIGMQSSDGVWGWRYDCLAVGRRRPDPDTGEPCVPVITEAVGGIARSPVMGTRIQSWYAPTARVWIERPADRHAIRSTGIAQEAPTLPPVRQLTRAHDADRVIGRYGWLAHEEGWQIIVAVSDLYELEVSDEVKIAAGREPRDSLRDTWVNVVWRQWWWRWGVTGEDPPDGAIGQVEADGVWLE